jgi:hypothetical protein
MANVKPDEWALKCPFCTHVRTIKDKTFDDLNMMQTMMEDKILTTNVPNEKVIDPIWLGTGEFRATMAWRTMAEHIAVNHFTEENIPRLPPIFREFTGYMDHQRHHKASKKKVDIFSRRKKICYVISQKELRDLHPETKWQRLLKTKTQSSPLVHLIKTILFLIKRKMIIIQSQKKIIATIIKGTQSSDCQ